MGRRGIGDGDDRGDRGGGRRWRGDAGLSLLPVIVVVLLLVLALIIFGFLSIDIGSEPDTPAVDVDVLPPGEEAAAWAG